MLRETALSDAVIGARVHHAARTVAEVMTKSAVTTRADTSAKDLAASMVRKHVNEVPVIDKDERVLGVVSVFDLLQRVAVGDRVHHRAYPAPPFTRRRRATSNGPLTAGALMTSPAIAVVPTTSIRDAARLALSRHIHLLPVVDDRGLLLGVVTGNDLGKAYLRPDDEIRTDVENTVVRKQMLLDPALLTVDVTDGTVRVAGMLATRDEAGQLVECLDQVPGVIEVRTRFTYREDNPD